jgi:hypothetical protein
VAQTIVEKRNPGYTEGEIFYPVEKEFLVEKEFKVCDNRKTAQRSWRKMGRQTRGHINHNMLQRSNLMHAEVPSNNETTWTKFEDKDKVEHHLIARNVEHFSHAGATPFGFTDIGKELGHTGDSVMAEEILDGTLEHDCMKDEAIRSIVQQLKRHPTIQGILTPIVSVKDFRSYFKCVPEKLHHTTRGDQCRITRHAQMDQKMDWPTHSLKFTQK